MSERWIVARGKQQQGPFSRDQLRSFASAGKLRPNDWLQKEGETEWSEACTVDGVFGTSVEELKRTTVAPAEPPVPSVLASPTVAPPPQAATKRNNVAVWLLLGGGVAGFLFLSCAGLVCVGVLSSRSSSPASDDYANSAYTPTAQDISTPYPSAEAAPAAAPMLAGAGEVPAWQSQAVQGDAESMYNLGYSYATGEGVGQDWSQAVSWFTKAADAGNAAAMTYLGYCYEYGYGVSQDYASAAHWYSQATERGDSVGTYNLGLCYAYGRGVTANRLLALQLLEKSAQGGYAPARQELTKLQTETGLEVLGALADLLSENDDGYYEDYSASFDEQREVNREYWESRARQARQDAENAAADAQRERLMTPGPLERGSFD